jgi:hypothetical protein
MPNQAPAAATEPTEVHLRLRDLLARLSAIAARASETGHQARRRAAAERELRSLPARIRRDVGLPLPPDPDPFA